MREYKKGKEKKEEGGRIRRENKREMCDSPPPPMIVMQPLPVSSARVVAIPLVPFAKASNSNTPIGPFQITAVQDGTR